MLGNSVPAASPPGRSAGSAAIELDVYLAVLFRRRYWLLAGVVAGALAGLGFAVTRPLLYEAKATVMISRSKIGLQGDPLSSGQGFRAFLLNQNLMAQVLREHRLDASPAGLTPSSFVAGHVTVEELVPGSMLLVRVSLPDPKVAAQVTNRLVALAIDLNRQVNTEESLAVRDFIKSQLEESRVKMEALERELLAHKRKAQLELRREEVESLLDQRRLLIDLGLRLEGEKARLARAQAQLQSMDRILPAPRGTNPLARAVPEDVPLPPVVRAGSAVTVPPPSPSEDPVASEATAQRPMPPASVPKESGRSPGAIELRSFPGRDWLAGGSQSSMINPVYEMLEYDAAVARTRIAELESRHDALVKKYGVAAPALRQLTYLYEAEIEQAGLQSEYDLAAAIHSDLFTRYEQARIQVASRSTELKLVDAALAPTEALRPSVPLTTALAGALGLGAAVLLAFVAAYLRRE